MTDPPPGPTADASLDRYRGAVVEDMQLPPAFALIETEPVARAMELAFDRDFSYIPVLSHARRPLGYLDFAALKPAWERGDADPDENVRACMIKFDRSRTKNYTLITPSSPLEDLEAFLEQNVFVLITDNRRKFVLGIATRQDLLNFVQRRGF